MSKVDINYEMVIQQQRDEDEQRQRQWEEDERSRSEPVYTGPSTKWLYGSGRTEEEADLEARSKMSVAQAGAIIERRVHRPEPKTDVSYGKPLEERLKMIRLVDGHLSVVIETKALPARRLVHPCRARSAEAAATLVRKLALTGGIRDPQDGFRTHHRVELKSVRAAPTQGHAARRLMAWLVGRRPYEVELETGTGLAVVYAPPVQVSFHVPED